MRLLKLHAYLLAIVRVLIAACQVTELERHMAAKKDQDKHPKPGADTAPAWAEGLKQLYDNVVEEPIPDAFKDLLAQLDDNDETGGGS